MAMIKCRECGKEISNTAEKCPHCGCKTRYGKEQEDKKGNGTMLYIGIGAIIIGLILFFPALFEMLENADNWYFWNYNSDHVSELTTKIAIGCGFLVGGGYSIYTVSKNNKK